MQKTSDDWMKNILTAVLQTGMEMLKFEALYDPLTTRSVMRPAAWKLVKKVSIIFHRHGIFYLGLLQSLSSFGNTAVGKGRASVDVPVPARYT